MHSPSSRLVARVTSVVATLCLTAGGVMLASTAQAEVTLAPRNSTAVVNMAASGPLPVPGHMKGVIESAALTCPILNRPRLAAFLMAAVAFNIGDPNREIPGAAAHLCDLAGQIRLMRLPGDIFPYAVAAFRYGIAAVRDAGGVPANAAGFVNEVNSYVNWYANNW